MRLKIRPYGTWIMADQVNMTEFGESSGIIMPDSAKGAIPMFRVVSYGEDVSGDIKKRFPHGTIVALYPENLDNMMGWMSIPPALRREKSVLFREEHVICVGEIQNLKAVQ